ncbi:unnamed protein product [Lymnaea stagnalis]|uniref:EGF-like domain-containing protein n=1 Tax=Lymnaea stagnalis TaxID=6523 RepID=A0AAV2IIG6_LYMST
MYLQHSITSLLLVLALSFTVMSTLEVINDMTTDEAEDFLIREEFIPADALAKESTKRNKRSLTSVSQNENAGKSSDPTPKAQAPKSTPAAATQPPTKGAPAKSGQHSSTIVVNNETSGKPNAVVAGGEPETKKPIVEDATEGAKGEDDIDLAGEGFLLIPEKVQSPTRKLSEFHIAETPEANDGRGGLSEEASPVENLNPENVQELDRAQESSVVGSVEDRTNDGPASEEALRSEDVQEPFVDDTDKVLDVACIDKSSWECLMFKEDYLAMKKDWNLSEKTVEKIRVKRQGDGNNAAITSTPAPTTTLGIDAGSGTGEIYPTTETKDFNIVMKSTSTFTNNIAPEEKKNEAMLSLARELERLFKGITGFVKVNVNNVAYENGKLIADWELIINPADRGFLSGNSSDILDKLRGEIGNVSGTFKAMNIPDLTLEGELDANAIEQMLGQVRKALADPCATNPCSPGFSNCDPQTKDYKIEITCEANCKRFDDSKLCEHGGVCELNATFGAYCSCTKNFEGEFCELKKSSENLDAGQITGVVLGAMAVAAGALGFCFWMLACRKSNKDIAFSHYSDEEGSGKFSNPSSKLSAFVIDRPQISVNPIQVFRTTPPSSGGSPPNSSYARRSSIGSLVSELPREPTTNYPYSSA